MPYHHSDASLMAMSAQEILVSFQIDTLLLLKGTNYREQTSINWGDTT